jgi:hypothetical protein
LLAILIYNSLIAVTTRSLAYVSYSAFLFSFALLECSEGGLGYALIWPKTLGLADVLTPTLVPCIGISSLIFTMSLLDLRQTAPRWFKLSKSFIFLGLAALPLPWILPAPMSMHMVLALIPQWSSYFARFWSVPCMVWIKNCKDLFGCLVGFHSGMFNQFSR